MSTFFFFFFQTDFFSIKSIFRPLKHNLKQALKDLSPYRVFSQFSMSLKANIIIYYIFLKKKVYILSLNYYSINNIHSKLFIGIIFFCTNYQTFVNIFSKANKKTKIIL
jgi:hypothetical protein